MDSINGSHYGSETETFSRIRMQEGIILLLSRWYALQMAVQNQWGGRDSLQKSYQLADDLFSWFSKSNCIYFIFLISIIYWFTRAYFVDPFMSYYVFLLIYIIALVPVEDLENLLHESMLLTFNTEIEDGSIEQVYMYMIYIQPLPLTFSICNFTKF